MDRSHGERETQPMLGSSKPLLVFSNNTENQTQTVIILVRFQVQREMAFSSSTKRKREMEENAFLGMAPAPASPTPTTDDSSFQRYDVFINHRGPDVKNSLASVLCEFLQYLGLKVFLDLTELLLGDSLSTNIQRAIRNCLVHIAIFSKRYAESPWCLAELSLMLKTGAKIVPLFYGVAPSDLRYVEKGPYAAAFATYLAKGRHLNRLDEWKQALHQASFITGIEFNPSDGNMGSLCKNIVDTVFNEVREAKNKSKLEVAEHPVGLEETIQELDAKISSCAEINNGNGKIVGVVGRSGVGKTTLAKEFYNRKHTTFCRSSFLFNVGKADADKKIGKLRHKLLRDISMPLPLSTGGKDGFGVDRIRSELERWYSKPLIILDGVDNVDQLEALAVNEFLNHGALIIVTCRDASVFQSFEMVKIYEMRGLDPKYARRLFCWHAFRRSHPPNGREKLVEDILKVSGGLPSDLRDLGQGIYTMLNDIDAEV